MPRVFVGLVEVDQVDHRQFPVEAVREKPDGEQRHLPAAGASPDYLRTATIA